MLHDNGMTLISSSVLHASGTHAYGRQEEVAMPVTHLTGTMWDKSYQLLLQGSVRFLCWPVQPSSTGQWQVC
jgi:hypothetical protein